ncbi:hypothetical protein LY76DRAFT_381331 [Colletotrichum caudatum]|nr:hypothetical protein LY76DRAFT_381331 [Colletotrichum caudatum]
MSAPRPKPLAFQAYTRNQVRHWNRHSREEGYQSRFFGRTPSKRNISPDLMILRRPIGVIVLLTTNKRPVSGLDELIAWADVEPYHDSQPKMLTHPLMSSKRLKGADEGVAAWIRVQKCILGPPQQIFNSPEPSQRPVVAPIMMANHPAVTLPQGGQMTNGIT